MIRTEQPEDYEAVYRVNAIAFGRENEAVLAERLRKLPGTLSLVAIEANQVIGHLLFSPITLENSAVEGWLGLGPVAVLPDHQRQGIGSQLIRQGLEYCRSRGGNAVVVLGDPQFYARFGFVPAADWGLRCEYDAPEGAFRVLELEAGALSSCWGLVRYRAEFNDCE
jgi:putative acetyltransferase